MIASDEMEAFVRDGFHRYAEAREAVDAFEHEVQERLLGVLEAKTDWRHFRAKRGERGRGKAISAGVWSGAIGRTIWSNQASEDGDQGWVDLGLWWRSPRARNGVLVYCSRWDQGYRLRPVALADPQPPVVCAPIDQNKARLFVPVDDTVDLDVVGRLLLDEMDRALAPPEALANPKR